MKTVITLTKMLVLAGLLVSSTIGFAAVTGDECPNKCCREKKEKKLADAMARLEKALDELNLELQEVTAVVMVKEVPATPVKVKRLALNSTKPMVFFAAAQQEAAAPKVAASQKINFDDLAGEMKTVQEQMTSAPDMRQKINFSMLQQEMNAVQEQWTRSIDQ